MGEPQSGQEEARKGSRREGCKGKPKRWRNIAVATTISSRRYKAQQDKADAQRECGKKKEGARSRVRFARARRRRRGSARRKHQQISTSIGYGLVRSVGRGRFALGKGNELRRRPNLGASFMRSVTAVTPRKMCRQQLGVG